MRVHDEQDVHGTVSMGTEGGWYGRTHPHILECDRHPAQSRTRKYRWRDHEQYGHTYCQPARQRGGSSRPDFGRVVHPGPGRVLPHRLSHRVMRPRHRGFLSSFSIQFPHQRHVRTFRPFFNVFWMEESMRFSELLCKIGLHDWERADPDVTRGTEYTKVCSRCRTLR